MDRRQQLQQELLELAKQLDIAERHGKEKDQPEGERYIVISDTCATRMSQGLVRVAEWLESINGVY